MSRRLLLVATLALLASASLASAHIQGARPILQRSELPRIIGLDPDEFGVDVDLTLERDPLRQFVTHYIDPTRGIFNVEHREDGSIQSGRFYAEWRFDRLVEYRDANVNGVFDVGSDAAVKVWSFSHYRWERQPLQGAEVGGVRGNDMIWTGNLTAAPHVKAEVFVAGRDFQDEGAFVRPQDVILYLDLLELPPRNIGSLYALDLKIATQGHAALSFHEAENTSTALLADVPDRRAMLVWGGEALLDGTEQRLDAQILDERVDDAGNRTATLRLLIPPADASIRMVFVSGIEYRAEDLRSTPAGSWGVAAAILAAALLAARQRPH